MKHKLLRAHLKSRNSKTDYVLCNSVVVIDGKTYFSKLYKESGCKYILGGEYDRYAHFLKQKLSAFIESNVKCYVIFNGASEADIDKRKEIHKNIIDKCNHYKPGDKDHYFEPLFARDVQKQVLDELEIPYYITEYDHLETMLAVVRRFQCPLLTSQIEFCMYGALCIHPNSITFNRKTKKIYCDIYQPEKCKRLTAMKDELRSIFMALVDEDSKQYFIVPLLTEVRYSKILVAAHRWIRQQDRNKAIHIITTLLEAECDKINFINSCAYYAYLMKHSRWDMKHTSAGSLAIRYFNEERHLFLSSNDDRWFLKAVSNGSVAVPYINLYNNGTFCGSPLLADYNKDDAMLIAMDIISYCYGLLKDQQEVSIAFIGRKLHECSMWNIECVLKRKVLKRWLFQKNSFSPKKDQAFMNFLNMTLPGFNLNLLRSFREDSWILMITLVYFYKKRELSNALAYSVILSYILLGPVTAKVGLIKRSHFLATDCNVTDDETGNKDFPLQDCAQAVRSFMKMFYISDVSTVFDLEVQHTLAEFQHCLQHMNYLNKLCCEVVKNTTYHKTLNVTFVYNVYRKMLVEGNGSEYVTKILGSTSVSIYFRNLVSVFNNCLLAIKPK